LPIIKQSFYRAMKNNIIADYFDQFKSGLQQTYPGLKLSYFEECLTLSKLSADQFLKKVDAKIPLEYITGKAFFYNHYFAVSPDVLIPRSETEILVEIALAYVEKLNHPKIHVADIGTGSGNIILSIVNDTEKKLVAIATDLSAAALNIAKKNSKTIHTAGSEVKFIQTDRLKDVEGHFDLIVSNPPYIKKQLDEKKVHKTVFKYEPHIALFLEDSQYEIWFEDLFTQVRDRLKSGAMFIMEGHEDHLDRLQELAVQMQLAKVQILKDYNNKNRFLKAFKE